MSQEHWWLPLETWRAMSPGRQRLHCINVAAFFIHEFRQRHGIPGTPEKDWLAAEYETDRRNESCDLYWRIRDMGASADIGEKIQLSVLYHVANDLNLKVSRVSDRTPLPTEIARRKALCGSIGYLSIGRRFAAPENAGTVGELIAALLAAPRTLRL